MTRSRESVKLDYGGFLVAALAFLIVPCGGSPALAQDAFHRECKEVYATGLFNRDTMACFPWLREAVNEKLCEAPVASLGLARWVGFGDEEVYGVEMGSVAFKSVQDPEGYVQEFGRARARWQAEHCSGESVPPLEFFELREAWREVYEKLPQSLLSPWQACQEYSLAAMSLTGPLCRVVGSYDVRDEGETVVFKVQVHTETWFDFRTRLTRDLETEGVDCGERTWRRGKKLKNFQQHQLQCRRRGRSAVRFRIVTPKGSCEAGLPELTEVSWRDQCEGEVGTEGEAARRRPGNP